ncbi:hypothetical protein D3C71_953570 [compost metagenome]
MTILETMKASFSIYCLLSIPFVLLFHYDQSKNFEKKQLFLMYITIMLFWLPSIVFGVLNKDK